VCAQSRRALRGIPELRRKLQNLEALRDLFSSRREKPEALRIGTRGSALALWQARSISEALRALPASNQNL